MKLSIKVGTHPVKVYRVVRLRKVPSIGQVFQIRNPHEKYEKPIRVRLCEYNEVRDTYFVERF